MTVRRTTVATMRRVQLSRIFVNETMVCFSRGFQSVRADDQIAISLKFSHSAVTNWKPNIFRIRTLLSANP